MLRTALFRAVMQRVVVISYRQVVQKRRKEPRLLSADSRTFKMEPTCPETSVRNHHYTLRNIPEEPSYHLPRGGSLMSWQYSPSDVLQVVCISVFFVAVLRSLRRLSRTSRLYCSGRGWSTAAMTAFLLLAQWFFCRPANVSDHPYNLSLV